MERISNEINEYLEQRESSSSDSVPKIACSEVKETVDSRIFE